MTLDKLVVENFGIYLSRHTVTLTPPSKKKPIVLFGGMNGAGKTTLLDALQLCLHGKRARCSNRGAGSYDDFLRSAINRFADPSDGAVIEVHFHHAHEGRARFFRVCRSWRAEGSGIKEAIDVFVDGTRDEVISDSWAEYAEEFVPARLSHLFFFDGEKIEALADLESASELLRSGIHSLLGLDIVDRLYADLDVVALRKNKQLKTDHTAATALDQAERDARELIPRRDSLVQEVASIRGQLEQCQYRLQRITERVQSEGGDLFRQKDTLREAKVRTETELESIDTLLREDASGIAPLALLSGALGSIHQQSQRERVAASAQLLAGVLTERDTLLLTTLKDAGAKTTLLNTVSDHLERDRRARTVAAKAPRYLSLSDHGQAMLEELVSTGIPAARAKIARQLARRKQLVEDLAVIDRRLSTVPEEDAIAPLEKERKDLAERAAALTRDLARLEEERRLLDNDVNRRDANLARLREQAMRLEMEQEDLLRVKDHCHRAQSALKAFREKVVAQHIAAIQDHVLQSFTYLLRKTSLVSSVTIDSRTFVVELRGGDGELLMPDRLSAGERQLLAVSLLWGLAKASRRPLPAVVDTPLGRLDSSHRRNLVERYFPNASHQVLLLSTDEEIRGAYLDAIRPSVGHYYLLEFDEAKRSSTIKPGYFEREQLNVH